MDILLLSNSTNYGESFLESQKSRIQQFLTQKENILFLPYAGISISYQEYFNKVSLALGTLNGNIHYAGNDKGSVHKQLEMADAIMVGGGNTFCLLSKLYEFDLIKPIQDKVRNENAAYLGWSAGSNVACPSIKTTNDMPICEPPSFEGLNLFPLQINPHFTQDTIPNHGGESRLMRLEEYVIQNKKEVICLPEGSYLQTKEKNWLYDGEADGFWLKQNGEVEKILPKNVLNFVDEYCISKNKT